MKVFLLAFGFAEHTRMLAGILSSKVDIALALPEEGDEPLEIRGVEERPFVLPRLRDPWGQIRCCAALRRDIHRAAPDIVHLQQGHLWFNALLPALKPPLTLTVHDHRHHVGDALSRKTPQWVMDFGFRQAGRLMAHSEHVKRGLEADCGIPSCRIDVLPPPLTGSLPAEFAAPPSDPPTVLFFGRLWPYKGLDVLLKAQPLVSQQVPDARFVIAGQGESLDRYNRQIQQAGCFDVINRWIGTAERAALFSAATVVVLPYLEATQSGVIPVAYAHGRPVVATRVGALPEVVLEEKTGLLVPPQDEQALSAALVRVLTDHQLRVRMSAGARAFAEAELTAERMTTETLASYERLLNLGQ